MFDKLVFLASYAHSHTVIVFYFQAEILLCVFVSVSLVQGIDLLEDLISFKEELINGTLEY